MKIPISSNISATLGDFHFTFIFNLFLSVSRFISLCITKSIHFLRCIHAFVWPKKILDSDSALIHDSRFMKYYKHDSLIHYVTLMGLKKRFCTKVTANFSGSGSKSFCWVLKPFYQNIKNLSFYKNLTITITAELGKTGLQSCHRSQIFGSII